MDIKSIIIEEIGMFNFNKTTFYDIDDLNIKRLLYLRKYSETVNNDHIKGFRGKSGKSYIIIKSINEDIFKVYDLNVINDYINDPKSHNNYLSYIGVATFDVHSDYFTGYKQSQSIYVNDNYRRDHIASAITDFAETHYNRPYQPTDLLSTDMQGFVNNRFK